MILPDSLYHCTARAISSGRWRGPVASGGGCAAYFKGGRPDLFALWAPRRSGSNDLPLDLHAGSRSFPHCADWAETLAAIEGADFVFAQKKWIGV